MPPIQPSNPVQTKNVIITSSDILNSIPLEIDGFISLSGKLQSTADFNGKISVQMQRDDLSWNTVFSIDNPLTIQDVRILDGSFIGAGTGNILENETDVYPFKLRIIVSTHATLGSVSARIDYL